MFWELNTERTVENYVITAAESYTSMGVAKYTVFNIAFKINRTKDDWFFYIVWIP